jgi:hypothetical protein
MIPNVKLASLITFIDVIGDAEVDRTTIKHWTELSNIRQCLRFADATESYILSIYLPESKG